MNSIELINRQQKEKSFFDKQFKKERHTGYYSVGFTSHIIEKMMEKLGNINGKKVLDFGCGEGWLSKVLLKKGAKVWAFDISEEAVKNVRAKSLQEWSSNHQVNVIQATAEALGFNADSFDYVIGNAILHHIDLGAAAEEIHRVLKGGGRAYFMEPLGHNPLLNWYRKRTPNLRSPDERPLFFKDLRIYKKLFRKFHHEEYYLSVLFALLCYFIFRNDQLMLNMRDILIKLDSVILRLFPSLKRYCWYSILIMEK